MTLNSKYGITFANAAKMYANNKALIKQIEEQYGLDMPRYASIATDLERKWMFRTAYGYTNWSTMKNILSQTDWQYLLGGFTPTSNYVSKVGTTTYGSGTIAKFFVAKSIPTAMSFSFADYIQVVVNGVTVFSSGSYHSGIKKYDYDFSDIIKLDDINYVVIKWYGSGNHGLDFGFTD